MARKRKKQNPSIKNAPVSRPEVRAQYDPACAENERICWVISTFDIEGPWGLKALQTADINWLLNQLKSLALSEFCVGSCGDDDDCGGSDLTGVPDGTSQISAAAR